MNNRGKLLWLITTSFLVLVNDVAAIPLEQFYPFGLDAGDNLLNRTLDGSSSKISLPRPLPFFGKSFDDIYVNNNGHLSFAESYYVYTPKELPFENVSLVAPYWADVDTRPEEGGFVWHRLTTSPDLLQRALRDIQRAYPTISDLDYLLIATWDHIGYFNRTTNKNNTFQCVLARSGEQSYAIYLYADGLIQWSASIGQLGVDGLGGNGAVVGYNSGDGKISFSVPGSNTDAILNIVSTSNAGVPGMWLFQLDSDNIVPPPCQDLNHLALLSLLPRHGNELGGTAVQVFGPCFQPSDVVMCYFGGVSSPGIFVSRGSVICVSPALTSLEKVDVTAEIRNTNGTVSFHNHRSAAFYSIPLMRAHGVDVEPSLLLQSGTDFQVRWDPQAVLPVVRDPGSFAVNVYVYTHNYKEREWVENVNYKGLPNNGRASIRLGVMRDKESVVATCIHISVGKATNSSSVTTKELLERVGGAVIPFPERAGLWSGLLFSTFSKIGLPTNRVRESLLKKFSKKCNAWHSQKAEIISDDVIKALPSCPPTLNRAQFPNSGLEEQRLDSILYNTDYHNAWMTYFHQLDATKCFTQIIVASGDAGQECCYNSEGNLVVGSRSGGSINRFAPVDFDSFNQHIQHDIIPYIYCCLGSCRKYYERRPSDDGLNYHPPPPAYVFGDPHFITLDGVGYTFNGKGEFTLLETDFFSLQGRMVEVVPGPSGGLNATVLSALVARQSDSDTVQFIVNEIDGIDTSVNAVPLDFGYLRKQSFLNVVVRDKGNGTYSAAFLGGAYIEVHAANSIMSLLVSLTSDFVNKTRGLLGNFNGNTLDDLSPNGDGVPLSPIESLPTEIHYIFGLSWIIERPEDSIFPYGSTPIEGWDTYYNRTYIPAFFPTFDDPSFEEDAMEICEGSEFCLFDMAATKRPEIGMTTAMIVQEFEMVEIMSQPIVCVPACENGACIATNTCLCTEGYIGNTCSEPVMKECEKNLCENRGICEMLAGSIICTCPPHLTGILCDNLLPPRVVSDTVADTPLMLVPLDINPNELGFTDYRDLISLCYEVRGAPRQNFNLVSTRCTSITARYSRLVGNSPTTTFGAVGIRTRGSDRGCHNMQVNRDCSVLYDKEAISNNLTVNDISIQFLSPDSVRVTVPNCGKEIVVHILCQRRPLDSVPVMNMTIVRSYAEPEIAHGLIGQFWSAAISTEPYDGNTADVTPGYPPYTVTVDHPEAAKSRKFVGVLIPRLWNHDPGQCVYAGNGQGGPTGRGQMDSVIQGEYIDYRVRGLFGVEYTFSQFQENLCF